MIGMKKYFRISRFAHFKRLHDQPTIVVCRSLGFSGGVVYSNANLGGSAHTDVPVHMDDVKCDGSETSIFYCRRADGHDCGHHEDVGISCD